MARSQIFNFIAIIIEKEYDPFPCPDGGVCLQQYRNVWKQLDNVCNVIFLLELAINYYGSGTKRFFTSGWNIFDSIVVLIGFLTVTHAASASVCHHGAVTAALRIRTVANADITCVPVARSSSKCSWALFRFSKCSVPFACSACSSA